MAYSKNKSQIRIEIFTAPGCSRCHRATEMIKMALAKLPETFEIVELNVLDHLEYATRLGIYTTPTIAVNGKRVFRGVPSKKQVMAFVQSLLEDY